MQWQHDAAEPHVALPHTLPGLSWHVPLMTHVYRVGQAPHDPPQPSLPHTIDPQNGMHGAAQWPCASQVPPLGQTPHDPPQPSSPHWRPVHCRAHESRDAPSECDAPSELPASMNGDPSCVPESEPVEPSSPPPPSSDVPPSDESIVADVPLHPATTPIAIAVTTYER